MDGRRRKTVHAARRPEERPKDASHSSTFTECTAAMLTLPSFAGPTFTRSVTRTVRMRFSVGTVKVVLTRAYTHSHVKTAKRLLQDLARRLDTDDPSAATSVREGLDETLTVLGVGLSERLQRSLATTNAIESLLSRTRHVQRHVKRWRGGTMVLRWVAAGVLEAAKGFRRVQGCQDMPALVAALRARDARLGLGESSEMVA